MNPRVVIEVETDNVRGLAQELPYIKDAVKDFLENHGYKVIKVRLEYEQDVKHANNE